MSGVYPLNDRTVNPSVHSTCRSSFSVSRRSYITLMEVLIVLVILSMVIGIIGVNLTAMAKQERFRAGSAFLVDRLHMAQDIMIIFGTDVTATLTKDTTGVRFSLEVDASKLNPVLQRATAAVNIPGIDSFTFTDPRGVTETDKVTLLFKSRGTLMSAGNLMLTAGPDLTNYIILKGYPQTIHLKNQPEPIETPPNLSDRLYPVEVIEREQKRNAT